MARSLVIDTLKHVGQAVTVSGWVHTRRDHGKISFLDLRDRSGLLQVVVDPGLITGVRSEDVVTIVGKVAARPPKLVNPKISTGTVELQAESVTVISKAHELPFDMGGDTLDVGLPVLLDHRSLTLRHLTSQSIFKVQASIAENFRKSAASLGCLEVFPPTISASATEGGTEVLPLDYFGYKAFMVQSPQLYKQMMVGVFERVFIITHIYRAEPSVTTRHLVESIQLDCELGFIENFSELLDALESTFTGTIKGVQSECAHELVKLGVTPSLVPDKVPRLTMRQAQQIIKDRTGVDHTNEPDLMPEDEREICAWAKQTHQSDLVTITHFPTRKRSFYTAPDPQNPEFSLSYDLLYKGLEISSGSQRIHDHDRLVEALVSRGLNPDDFSMYLQAFKYGMPPHGGFSYGLERTTMKLLDLANIREASLYPRDLERVDFRLSELQPKQS